MRVKGYYRNMVPARSVLLLLGMLMLCGNICHAQDTVLAAPSVATQQANLDVAEPAADTQPAAVVTPFYEQKKAPALTSNNAPSIGSGGHLLNVTLGLAAIVGLIFVLSFFVKRFGSGSFLGNNQLKIVSVLPLGTRERVVLIDAGGQQLLLGITPTQINTLHVFSEPISALTKPEVSSDFSKKLMSILQQKPNVSSANNNSAQQE